LLSAHQLPPWHRFSWRLRSYGEYVTAAAHHPEPGDLDSPREIWAALLPEERAEFDAAYKQALTEAGETRSLNAVFVALECWRRIARQTLADPAAHRAMLQQADRTLRTGEPPAGAVSLDVVRARLAL